MQNNNEELMLSLSTSFINKVINSKRELRPELLTNNPISGRKVLTAIEKGLEGCDSYWFSVAFVTMSGFASLANIFREINQRGINGKILVSQYLNFTQPLALKHLLQLSNLELRIAVEGNLHTKGYFFKQGELSELIVGSSNLTATALSQNREWNLKISATTEGAIIEDAVNEFEHEFSNAVPVDLDFIKKYEERYEEQVQEHHGITLRTLEQEKIKEFKPNSMQEEAIGSLKALRNRGQNRALVISATGTGKTFLSAFDAKEFKPKRLLFLVHRHNIAKTAQSTFEKVFGSEIKMAQYTIENRKNVDFLFGTIQTLSKDKHLEAFAKDHFDYIIIDETHRAGATSYQKIIDYFQPKFLLGMTATPERGDGFDIFKLFNYNIAYEIRLHAALGSELLSPFHYFGVTDLTVNGKVIEENSDFKLLTSEARVNHILEKVEYYGSDDGNVRGLVFCSRKQECHELSEQFNARGYKTIALTGDSTEDEREKAILALEHQQAEEKIDYIFTVDIFNEGIDIPAVNQVIMLRATQSAIIFVQQLGRGLRKTEDKEYLTVIDFIGNYKNNYMVPIALYGDTTYNKDTLRKLMASGSAMLPGTSTISFDQISKEKIFESINSANMRTKADLTKDYEFLKQKIGKIPMMVDFLEHGSRDPFLYVQYAKSYFSFIEQFEETLQGKLHKNEKKLLEVFTYEVNNGKRIEETLLLQLLLEKGQVSFKEFEKSLTTSYSISTSRSTFEHVIHTLNLKFFTERKKDKFVPIGEIYDFETLQIKEQSVQFSKQMLELLEQPQFKIFFKDSLNYSKRVFESKHTKAKYLDGFFLYEKYSRKDVMRILNWEVNPVPQTIGGYILNKEKTVLPLFVTYHKHESISSSTKYEDSFVSKTEFEWMSKSNRTLESPEIGWLKEFGHEKRIPLFVKKNDDEGTEFYFIGELEPIKDSFEESSLENDEGKRLPVVKLRFIIEPAVEENIFDYLIS